MRLKLVAALILLTAFAFAQEAQPRRIVRPIDNASVVRLQGTMHPRVRAAADRGPVSPTMSLERMMLVFQPTPAQQAALDQLLADQQDPSSVNYHQWLTPEQFADRFGLPQPDIDVAAAWLRSQGFTVVETARGRTWIAFSGIAAQAEAAFRTSIHNYLVDGKMHFAASSDVSVPDAFAGVVAGIGGLHDFAPRPLSVKPQPRVTSSLTGNHFLAPGDFATIYNLPSYTNGAVCTSPCNDGTGQTIAVMGQTDLSTDSNPGRNGTPGAVVNGQQQQYDVVTFRNLAGLPALTSTNFQIVVVPPFGDPGVVTSDVDEANLDVEWAGATAPNANLIYVIENSSNGGNGAFGALEYAVNKVAANVFSISYGLCEPQVDATDKSMLTAAGVQANAQGQTIVAPAGDSGAADCDTTLPATMGLAVDFPGSLPTVTSMGGTTFSADSANSANPSVATPYWAGSTNDIMPSALAYIPETAWNDSSGATTGTINATGGGASGFFTKPPWQTGPGVPQDGQRDVPDISFNASPGHDGYLICSQSSCVNGYRNTDTTFDEIGGTSAPTPSFAGVVSLINQKQGSPQGNVNPTLYSTAANSPWAFNDITTGNNIVACTSGTGCTNGSLGYSAGPGYDQVTGLGSPNVGVLLNAIAGVADFSVTPSPTSVTIATNGSTTVTLNLLGTSGSTITLACSPSSPLTATTCSASPASVTTNGSTVVSSTLTVATTSGSSETGAVNVLASNGSTSHVVPITVNVNGTNPDFQIASTNGTETVPAGGTTIDTISVTSLQGFNRSVSFTSCTGTTGLTCSLNPNSVTPSTSAAASSTLTVAASATAATGSITITATSGAIVHTLQILVTVNASFTLTASPSALTLSSGQAGTATLTIAPLAGFNSTVALTCSVSSSLGTTTCFISPTTITGGSGTATLTVQAAVLSRDRSAPLPFQHRGNGTYATVVFALGMVFTVNAKRSLRSKRAWRNGLFGLFLLCVMFGALSCGGGGSGSSGGGPTPLSGTVTVTATSGNLTNSTTVNLTVQ